MSFVFPLHFLCPLPLTKSVGDVWEEEKCSKIRDVMNAKDKEFDTLMKGDNWNTYSQGFFLPKTEKKGWRIWWALKDEVILYFLRALSLLCYESVAMDADVYTGFFWACRMYTSIVF